jgi:hypothetical protein
MDSNLLEFSLVLELHVINLCFFFSKNKYLVISWFDVLDITPFCGDTVSTVILAHYTHKENCVRLDCT